MKTLLMGAVGVLVLQALLFLGYLAVYGQDPIIRQDPITLNPPGGLDLNGVRMVMFCGENSIISGSGRGMLDKVPPDGHLGPWTRGRTMQGDCTIWYHQSVLSSRGD